MSTLSGSAASQYRPLAKNDAIDAEMIAWFAESFTEAPSQTHDAAHEELLALAKARISLVELRMRLQSQSEHAGPGPAQKAHVRVLKSLAGEVANLEAVISAKIKSTPHLAERAEIIESVPGFAETTCLCVRAPRMTPPLLDGSIA